MSWITITPELTRGIEAINSINSNKFPLLLSRIFETVEGTNEDFSEENLQKLKVTFNKSDEELKLVLETLKYIVKKCNRYLMKPTILQHELIEKLKFNMEIATSFTQLWTANTKEVFGDLQTLKKLESFPWELNLEIASNLHSKVAVPTSVLQFNVKDDSNVSDRISVEMDESELLQFYTELEMIQKYLDNIKR